MGSKIGYITLYGGNSTAYLDIEIEESTTRATGVCKYTDEPLVVEWDESKEKWVEVEDGDGETSD